MILFTIGKTVPTIGKNRRSSHLGIGFIEKPWETPIERLNRRKIEQIENDVKAIENRIRKVS